MKIKTSRNVNYTGVEYIDKSINKISNKIKNTVFLKK